MKLLYTILLSLTICLSAFAQDNSFTAGPYLLDVTMNSAVVAFHLDKPMFAKVKISQGSDVKEFTSKGQSISHFIKITGLKSGMTYDYQVICGDGKTQTPAGDKSFQIRTVCRQGKSFSFAVYGDTRPGDNKTSRYHEEIIKQVALQEPSFALVLGDMVDDGSKAQLWNDFFQIESKLLRRAAIYPVLGTYDYADSKGLYSHYLPPFSKGYYHFEWGGVQFFALNAWGTRGNQNLDELAPGSEQLKWFETEISKDNVQKSLFRVVFLHDPVCISRGQASPALRQYLVPLFKKYNVDVVFASWHLYERSINEGINYIITGGAGAELIWMDKDKNYQSQAEAREYHFCKVDINSNAMTISALTADGTVLDSIMLTPKTEKLQAEKGQSASRLAKEIHIAPDENNPSVPLYFFSSDCDFCKELLNVILPKLARENKVSLEILYYNLGNEGIYELLKNAESHFGRHELNIPALFIGKTAMGGESEIRQNLPKELAEFRQNPDKYLEQTISPLQN